MNDDVDYIFTKGIKKFNHYSGMSVRPEFYKNTNVMRTWGIDRLYDKSKLESNQLNYFSSSLIDISQEALNTSGKSS